MNRSPSPNRSAFDRRVFSPNGAEEKSHIAKRAVLEKQVNANMEGMGYGG